jgi:hypothetical protein
MGKESWNIRMAECMKGSGSKTKDTEGGSSDMLTRTFTKASFSSVRPMVKDDITGTSKRKFMMASGKRELGTGTECGRRSAKSRSRGIKLIPTSESGRKAKQMGLACIHGRMEIDTKASGFNAWNMGKELTFSEIKTNTQDNTKTENLKGKVPTPGKMEATMKASSRRGWNVAMVNGRSSSMEMGGRPDKMLVAKSIRISSYFMKEDMKMIRRMAKGFSLGLQEMSTKVCIAMTRERATERWSGRTAAST